MRKIISIGTAVVLALIAVATWATATTHSHRPINASAALGSQIAPFDLMKNVKDLPHQQYDAY